MFKIVMYNSIHNKNGIIKHDTSIVKITTNYHKAIEIALKLKIKTGKLYKIERV